MTNSYKIAERINSDVNASVTYKTDLEQYSRPEFWCEARSGFDDCDVTIFCALNHVTTNFARKDLHLACCWCETGEYHAVLLCNTSKGWFVLDNRYTWPMSPKSLPYRWDKALDEVDGKWYELSF